MGIVASPDELRSRAASIFQQLRSGSARPGAASEDEEDSEAMEATESTEPTTTMASSAEAELAGHVAADRNAERDALPADGAPAAPPPAPAGGPAQVEAGV